MGIVHSARLPRHQLGELHLVTKLSMESLRNWQRNFLRVCPTGRLSLGEFQANYASRFPFGNSEQVFNAVDTDRDGKIDFKELMIGLCVTHNWPLDEKLKWSFDIYDLNCNGFIEYSELLELAKVICQVLGKNDRNQPAILVNSIYASMGKGRNSRFTRDEFVEGCKRDETIRRAFGLNDGLLKY
ncbi:EF-hand [Schizopora paradoxa]|uniref:EF-hand n=1 Tax=Schizopora paradoxa TaxID=27342 RepID=A0A0H2SDJ5_9AGAM|nr:EF-hand [Schizopora paradoxa]